MTETRVLVGTCLGCGGHHARKLTAEDFMQGGRVTHSPRIPSDPCDLQHVDPFIGLVGARDYGVRATPCGGVILWRVRG